MLHITSLVLIYLISESLYLLATFIQFPLHQPLPPSLGTTHLQIPSCINGSWGSEDEEASLRVQVVEHSSPESILFLFHININAPHSSLSPVGHTQGFCGVF